MRALAIFASVLLPVVVAQSGGDIDLGIKAIEAHFNQSHIVPDFLTTFQPKALLNINYGSGNVQPGQMFTKEQVNSAPTLSVQSSSPLTSNYLLAMMDADVPNSKLPQGTNRHWLVPGVTIGQDSVVSNTSATATTRYWGPWPAAGSGPHRYVILLYSQPSNFAPPEGFTGTDMPVEPMDWNAYVTNSHLGELVAANYIQVEEGTTSTSIFSTAPVITSTLTASSTGSGSPAATSTRPNNANKSNAAGTLSLSNPMVMGLTSLAAFLLA
ncbi:OV-16 antigen [Leucoagaricus sp. SymC.cos]|nr:OV-16 antigen [Leucoagaricus sp. SymC.cos]